MYQQGTVGFQVHINGWKAQKQQRSGIDSLAVLSIMV
jgi:primosomal replication protein N